MNGVGAAAAAGGGAGVAARRAARHALVVALVQLQRRGARRARVGPGAGAGGAGGVAGRAPPQRRVVVLAAHALGAPPVLEHVARAARRAAGRALACNKESTVSTDSSTETKTKPVD